MSAPPSNLAHGHATPQPAGQINHIQPHGVLIALGTQSLRISHISANYAAFAGVPAESLLGLPLAAATGALAADTLLRSLESAERFTGKGFHLTLAAPSMAGTVTCSALAHGGEDRLIFELERPAQESRHSVVAAAEAILERLRASRSLQELYQNLTHEMRHCTGYDRAMLFQFDDEGHAEIVAEDCPADRPRFMHAHYPAADFSGLSRQLYVSQRTRVIPDCRYQPVPILGGPEPLDLSRCFLRGAPPELMTYVKLMGAAGVMVNAIVREERLWGLLVCQHRQPRNPSRGTRALCNLLCQMVGLLVGELQARDLLAAQIRSRCMLATIAERLETRRPILEGLASAADSLLGLVGASGAYVRLGGQSRSFGQTPSPVIAEAMLAALRPAAGDDVSAIHALGRLHPQFSSEADIASGVLLAPVLNDLGDGVIWFRPGQAGRAALADADGPDPAVAALRQKALPPGRDTRPWEDVVRGKSAAWTESELLAAQDLRRILTRALLRQTEAELIRVSNADPLTGLPNRRVLNQRLAAWRAQPERPAACLLFLDIDRFKMVNDSLGHFAGDELLRQFAIRLAPLATENRLLSRLGGDEFVIFCEDLDEAEALVFANHVLGLFKERFALAGRPHRASASIGLACAKSDPQDLLREADAAMYVAKRQGGNRIAVFAPTQHSHNADKLRTEQDLFLALERNELLLHYQPLVDPRTRKIKSYEALVRWRHPERGLLYPDSFIGLAEETGLIGQIGEFVAASTIRQLAACTNPLFLIGINVSASQLLTGGFAEYIRLQLLKHRVSGLRLAIEVTESTLMNDQALAELQRMREFGCRVAIDDFGTGYSSLSYLRRLPVDSVKIDRAFLPTADAAPGVMPGAEPGTEQEVEPFLRAIVTLAKTLNLRVIAEGVETEPQCALISAIGCDLAQGYLFGRPLPPDQWGMAEAMPDRPAPPPRRRPAAKVLSSA